MINEDTEKSSELKRFRMTHSPRNKAANFFGLRLIFFEKKKKKKQNTHANIFIYPKTTFREEGIAAYCIQILGDLKELGNIAPTPSSKKYKKWEKMRSPAHARRYSNTEKLSNLSCLSFLIVEK